MAGDGAVSEAELPPAVGKAVAAANAGDVDGFLGCFDPDGVVDDWGRRFVGRAAIRGWSDQEFIGVQVRLDVLEVERSERSATVLAQVGGNGFRGQSHFSFKVEGSSIAEMAITA